MENALVKFRVGGTDPPVVVKAKAGFFIPTWSPTGEWITFLSSDGEWWLVSPDGKSERKLGGFRTLFLMWSRDGKTLYGIRFNEKQHHIFFSLDVASGRQKELEDMGTGFAPRGRQQGSYEFSLAPDGRSVAISMMKVRSDLWMIEGFNSPRGWFWRW